MIELHHLDVRHFVFEGFRHLAKGCTAKCGCIGFIFVLSIICLGAIICNINTIGCVSAYARRVCDTFIWLQVVQPFTRRLHCPWNKMDVPS